MAGLLVGFHVQDNYECPLINYYSYKRNIERHRKNCLIYYRCGYHSVVSAVEIMSLDNYRIPSKMP